MARNIAKVKPTDVKRLGKSDLYTSDHGYIGPKHKALAHQANTLKWSPRELPAGRYKGVDPATYSTAKLMNGGRVPPDALWD